MNLNFYIAVFQIMFFEFWNKYFGILRKKDIFSKLDIVNTLIFIDILIYWHMYLPTVFPTQIVDNWEHKYKYIYLSPQWLCGNSCTWAHDPTSCAQVHDLRQSHCGDNRQCTFSWLHIYIYRERERERERNFSTLCVADHLWSLRAHKTSSRTWTSFCSLKMSSFENQHSTT